MNNLTLRILSSLIILPLSIFFIYKGEFYFKIFLVSCIILIIFELKKLISNKFILFIGTIFLLISVYSAFELRYFYVDNEKSNLILFISTILISISSDIGGYIVGGYFKGPKLSKISPNKTYSGLFGAIFLSILVLTCFINFFKHDLNFFNLILENNLILFLFIIISASLISQLGDLSISYLKRKANLKNTGNIIPGHGGILDRVDGIIISVPINIFFYTLSI